MSFLDTHKAIERIIATGISKESAEAIVESVNIKNDELVTKTDLRVAVSELRTELKTDIHELRTELKTDISAINTNVKWLIAIVLVLVGILLKNTLI